MPADRESADADKNAWELVLGRLQEELSAEDFHHWLGTTAYASDSGDHITVWVPSESIRRHIDAHYRELIYRALASLGRSGTQIRFVVAGFDDEEGDEE